MSITRYLMFTAVLALLGFSTSVFANYTCSGQVKGVSLDVANGDLIVESIGSNYWLAGC